MTPGSCRWIALAAFGCALAAPGFAAATDESPEDLLLGAMKAELDRSVSELAVEGYPKPYFIAYQLKDTQTRGVAARDGAIHTDDGNRSRLVRAEVRVGDYELDNTEDQEGQSYDELTLYQAPAEAPIDDSPAALRHLLWRLTDQRYKMALTSYHRVKGKRVYETEAERSKRSFTREEPARHRDAIAPLTFDEDRWRAAARKLSAQVARPAWVFDSAVEIEVRKVTQLFVSSEGSEIVTDQAIYGLHVRAMSRADDGMLLEHSIDHYGRSESDLPDLPRLEAEIETMLAELFALRAAPELEPYTGPAILEPRATGVIFHEAVGHRLEANRQDDRDDGRTFTGQVGRPVLPAQITVIDDPTLGELGGVPLNGAYRFDDEGVAAQRTLLIERGVLRSFLTGRKPTEGTSRSNGHGRAQANASPVARMGNLIVETNAPLDRAALEKALLDEVRRQGKPFGLIVGDIIGGSTNTSTYGYQAFKGAARMVYKVDAKTGDKTLVRGVEIVGTPLASINKIAAAGSELGVFNGYCGAESGYVPVSTAAPAMLFSEIELQRSAQSKQRGQILPPPEVVPRAHDPEGRQ
jgi:predicted Zn-dependent protease